jgi:hypothetical protein
LYLGGKRNIPEIKKLTSTWSFLDVAVKFQEDESFCFSVFTIIPSGRVEC